MRFHVNPRQKPSAISNIGGKVRLFQELTLGCAAVEGAEASVAHIVFANAGHTIY